MGATVKRSIGLIVFFIAASLVMTTALGGCGATENGTDVTAADTADGTPAVPCEICGKAADKGCQFCADHRCAYSGARGRCRLGVSEASAYCAAHASVDLDEFREAERAAEKWNVLEAMAERGRISPPFCFTEAFSVEDGAYLFEALDLDDGSYCSVAVVKDGAAWRCDIKRP